MASSVATTRTRHPSASVVRADGVSALDVPVVTRGVAHGDADAFEILYRAWYDRVFAMACALSRRDESFCLDVAQEVMLRAAKALKPVETEAQLAAWLGRVTMSVAVDMIRRESRRKRRERAACSGESGESAAPVDPEEHADLRAWLATQLRELSASDRGLLIQRFGLGRTLSEAGADAGLTAHAAHGRLRRAVEKLRDLAQEFMP